MHILKGIDLEIVAGEFLILVGPSGCGKSTLLNMIAGLEEPTGGTMHIGGRDVTHAAPPKDRDIAMVFQSYALYPHMTWREHRLRAGDAQGAKAEREAGMAKSADAADRAPAGPQARPALRRPAPAASRWAAPWCATRRCSCSTSRCPTSTPSCASRCAPRSNLLHQRRPPPRSTSPTTRSRR